MAQSQRRMVYSKIWSSQQFGKLSANAKLLFVGMITLADDDGRLVGDCAYLRGQVFPYDADMSVNDVVAMREEIKSMGLIEVYRVEPFEYIQHPKWEEYQSIRADLYKSSTLPDRNGKVTQPLQKSSLSKDKISKDKLKEEAEKYLSQVPTEDIKQFTERFEVGASGIKSKAESLLLWCKTKGEYKKDNKAFLLNALKRDFKERPPKKEISPPEVEVPLTPEQAKEKREGLERLREHMTKK